MPRSSLAGSSRDLPPSSATPDTVRHYTAFGLVIASQVELPSFEPCRPAPPDVTIRYGTVPEDLDGATARTPMVVGRDRELLLRPPHSARLIIREGREVVVDPDTVSTVDRLTSWLTTSAVGALLHQRGVFPLHASAIAVGDEVVLFTGDRRAGKSTLMSALVKRGFSCAADDVVGLVNDATPIGASDSAGVCALPGLTWAKLWGDAAETLGVDVSRCRAVEAGLDKHFVDWSGAPQRRRPVRAVYALAPTEQETLTFERLEALPAVETLLANVYRPFYARALGALPVLLQTATLLARQAAVTRVRRPREQGTVHDIAERVVRDLEGGSNASDPAGAT